MIEDAIMKVIWLEFSSGREQSLPHSMQDEFEEPRLHVVGHLGRKLVKHQA